MPVLLPLLVVMAAFLPLPSFSQTVFTPINMPLGGGGVSYLTGYEANFINPANLMIRDHPSEFHLGIGNGGYLYDPVSSSSGFSDQIDNFRSVFAFHQIGNQQLLAAERNTILERNYENNRAVSRHQNRYEILLGGMVWQREKRSLSIAARSRMGIRTKIGRGWYDQTLISENGRSVQNRVLAQQQMILHEISIGYAEKFELLSGLIPRINQFYVGIAPKLIFSGSFLDFNSESRIVQNESDNQLRLVNEMELFASGDMSSLTSQYISSGDAQSALENNLASEGRSFYTDMSNVGVGFDFGITYVLTLGRDVEISSVENRSEPIKKSLRIGFSITDLGFVSFTDNPIFLKNSVDTTNVAGALPVADSKFIGSPGQYIDFFDRAVFNANPLLQVETEDRSTFSSLLPTSFNGGVLFELNRVTITADFTLGLNNTAFSSTNFISHFGIELRPHTKIPLRFGTRIARQVPSYLGIGSGIETDKWDFLISTQLSTNSSSLFSEMTGITFGGIRYHF